MYSKHIKEKQFAWGGKVLATTFPAHGSVSIAGSIAGGSRLTQSEELAKVHAAMLLEGTKKHTKKELQIALDALGASLSFSAGADRLYFSAHVRAAHLDALLALISEILRESSFPPRELKLLKQRESASLALEAQDTRTQADILLSRLLYAPGHPNFDESTVESKKALATITSQKLRAYHTASVNGASLVLSIAGDSTPADVFSRADKHFKKLPRQTIHFPPYAKSAPHKAQKAAMHIEHKAGLDYMLGIATGITKNDPDYAPLMLGIQILGVPGFAGRLMKTVREEEGLTYGIYSYMSGFENNADGHISVWATFAPQLFEKGKTSTMREIRAIIEKGVTAEEVRKHRIKYEASARVRLSNSAALANIAHSVVAEGRSLSYIDEFPKRVLRLTARDVNRALKKYVVPAKLSEAAAGPVEKNAPEA